MMAAKKNYRCTEFPEIDKKNVTNFIAVFECHASTLSDRFKLEIKPTAIFGDPESRFELRSRSCTVI